MRNTSLFTQESMPVIIESYFHSEGFAEIRQMVRLDELHFGTLYPVGNFHNYRLFKHKF